MGPFRRRAAVGIDAVSNFVVVWHGFPGSSSGEVYGQRFVADGTEIGFEFQANGATAFQEDDPDVGVNPAGNFVIAWHRFGTVRGQLFDTGGFPVGSEFVANTSPVGIDAYPTVGIDAGSEFTVVWRSNQLGGQGDGIFGQRFDAAGIRLGPEFQLDTFIDAAQRDPSLAMDPFGNFVTVWESFGQIADGRAAFGRYISAVNAPLVVRGFCNGMAACEVPIGDVFSVGFDFEDPDGDAVLWVLTLVRDDGEIFDSFGQGAIAPPSGMGTVNRDFAPFTCPSNACRETRFDFVFVVSDMAGGRSVPLIVSLTIPASS
jgi:hypothetical protein